MGDRQLKLKMEYPVPSYRWHLRAELHGIIAPEDNNFNVSRPSESDIFKFIYEGHLESKERFAIKKYLLIIGKKKNMQVLSHTFTYYST